MADFLIDSTDLPTLQAAAQQMGFWNPAPAPGDFIRQGPIPGDPNPMASFFLNVVGVHYEPTGATTTDGNGNTVPVMGAVAGYWTRIRINGADPFKAGLIAVPATLTIYSLFPPTDGSAPYWTKDGGVTQAPAYLSNIGDIA